MSEMETIKQNLILETTKLQEIYLQEALELSDLLFDNNLDKLYFLKQYLKSFEYQHNPNENIKQIKLTR